MTNDRLADYIEENGIIIENAPIPEKEEENPDEETIIEME